MKKVIFSSLLILAFSWGRAQTITSFSPLSGPIGTSVTISGVNFDPTPANNVVFFGATRASVTAATASQLTVVVPSGATYSPISLTVAGGVALSSASFLVTFPGGGSIDPCTLNPKVDFSTGALFPRGIVNSDFDGDGLADLACTFSSINAVSTFRNTSTPGNLSFGSRVDFTTATFPDGLEVGDLDGDGKQDLAVVNATSLTVSIMRNISTPGTITFDTKVDVGTGLTNASHITVSDIDGDGKLDLIVPNNFTKVSVLRNLSTPGSIAFAAKVDFTVHGSSSLPFDVAVNDLDGDNKPDLAVTITSGSNRVSVLRNTSTVGVIDAKPLAPFIQFVTGATPFDIQIGDLDADGKPELITVNLGGNTISILKNTSTTGVLDATSFAPKVDFLTLSFPNSLVVDDFNGDGKPDLAISRQNSTSDLTVLQHVGTPGMIDNVTFTGANSFSTGPIVAGNHFVAAGDFDGDGKSDIILTNNKLSAFLNSTITDLPTITSYDPTLGPIGTTVTITGTNFSPIPSRNTVKFNGVTATVTASSATEITTTVPFDATPGSITVSVGCFAVNTATGPGIFTVNGDCVTSVERNALIAFYNATNGNDWNNNSNWLTADEDSWFGVTVTGCYVTSLSLGENNLTGFLTNQISNLTHLTLLHLKENQIGGNIPSAIGSLANLAILDLSTNVFTSMSNFSSSLLDQTNLDFNVNHNLLGFGTLEPNMVFDQLHYDPQDLVHPGDIIPFIPGQSFTIPFSTTGTANSYRWFKGGVPISGPSSTGDYVKTGALAGDAGQYTVEITNSIVPGLVFLSEPFTVMTDPCDGQPRLAGNLDLTFDPDIASPAPVTAVGVQSTGKIVASVSPGSGIVRYEIDGSIDGSFASNSRYATPGQLLIQQDDKILVGLPTGHLLRLNADGTPDPSFDDMFVDQIHSFALQPDGKVLVSSSSESPTIIERLLADGSGDPSFAGPEDYDANVIRVQPDGFILLGGPFAGTDIVRLDETGAIDPSFLGNLNGEVNDIALQSDGKIIVVGRFTDTPLHGVVRLNSDGTVDNSFSAIGITGLLYGSFPLNVLIESDGKIIISGQFNAAQGSVRKNIIRLNPDGTADCSFDPAGSTNTLIKDIILDANENILIAGSFISYDGSTRNGLARVTNTAGASCIPPIERAALVALYNSTNGAGWTNKTNWLSADESIWFGVTVSSCHVTAVQVPGNNLVGTIPTQLGNLSDLIYLDLLDNHLSGAIPVELGSLDNVVGINLSKNQLTGTIPVELGNMGSLEFLELYSNQLSGTIPATLFNATSIAFLRLSDNQLTGTIPSAVGNLPDLFLLDLDQNQLTGSIPPELENNTHLKYLNLFQNQLSGSIPIQLGNLAELEVLYTNTNQLTGTIPSSLGSLASLVVLNLGSNQLTGAIPVSLGSLSNLEELSLYDNHLTGIIPPQFGNITTLKYLNLHINQLTGPIPVELGGLANLEVLDIFVNQLTGPLPKELALCTNLTDLEVGENLLSGTLPMELGSLANMRVFMVHYNNFTGPVPVEYAAWPAVEEILMSNNQLDGIPTFTAPTITQLQVENNLLEFGDLESNMVISGYTYDPQADLPGGSFNINAGSPLTIPFTTSGTANQYQWFKDGTLIPGATSATFSIASTTVADAGNYTVAVTSTLVTGLTINSMDFVVGITPVIVITLNTFDEIVCDGDIGTFVVAATGTTNIVYRWQYSPDSIVPFVDLTDTGGYSGTGTPTLSINTTGTFGAGRYRCRINGDLAAEVLSFDEGLFIFPPPSAPLTSGNSGCASTNITLTASGGSTGQYRWYTLASGGTAISGITIDTYSPLLTSNTTFYVAINNGTCESPRTSVLATVFPLPTPPVVTAGLGCAPTATVLLNASGGSTGEYRWYTTPTGGSSIIGETSSSYTTPVLSATTTFYVSINNGTCESVRISVLAEIKSCTPVIAPTSLQTEVGGQTSVDITPLVTTINSPIDPISLKVTQQPISGALATITSGVLMVDYEGVSFAGTDRLTIEACDLASHCAQAEITIEVVGEVTVYNAISPNGDGKNEEFIIQYIDVLPDTKNNRVTIFNRWGDVVFNVDNYDNQSRVFRGLNNNGNELPTGTYFYKLEFPGGAATRSGFISLRK